MNIDELTLGQIKEITKLVGCNNAQSEQSNLNSFAVGEYVIVRTYSAGVFFGKLKERCGKEAVLENSRRIWSWSGAFTLSKVAENGVSSAKMSVIELRKLVTECIEIIPCSDTAKKQLEEMISYE